MFITSKSSEDRVIDQVVLQKRIAFAIADYYQEITKPLYESAFDTLIKKGFSKENLKSYYVPGAFELPFTAQNLLKKNDAVICIGCVIQGQTKHFDFICDAVAKGILEVSLKLNKPIIFGVLTPQNMKQARNRSGGKYGNKGIEFAETVISMLSFSSSL